MVKLHKVKSRKRENEERIMMNENKTSVVSCECINMCHVCLLFAVNAKIVQAKVETIPPWIITQPCHSVIYLLFLCLMNMGLQQLNCYSYIFLWDLFLAFSCLAFLQILFMFLPFNAYLSKLLFKLFLSIFFHSLLVSQHSICSGRKNNNPRMHLSLLPSAHL